MENKTKVFFHKPQPEDLWFREALLAGRETAEHGGAREGTVPFAYGGGDGWYDLWVRNPERRFYRYIATGKSRSFAGEAAWQYDDGRKIYVAEVTIMARCRGQGIGGRALELLCEAARKAGIRELYGDIAAGDPAAGLLIRHGFREESRADGIITLKKELDNREGFTDAEQILPQASV